MARVRMIGGCEQRLDYRYLVVEYIMIVKMELRVASVALQARCSSLAYSILSLVFLLGSY